MRQSRFINPIIYLGQSVNDGKSIDFKPAAPTTLELSTLAPLWICGALHLRCTIRKLKWWLFVHDSRSDKWADTLLDVMCLNIGQVKMWTVMKIRIRYYWSPQQLHWSNVFAKALVVTCLYDAMSRLFFWQSVLPSLRALHASPSEPPHKQQQNFFFFVCQVSICNTRLCALTQSSYLLNTGGNVEPQRFPQFWDYLFRTCEPKHDRDC